MIYLILRILYLRKTILNRIGASLYFSSKASSWVTGTILNVDGGTVGSAQIPLSSL